MIKSAENKYQWKNGKQNRGCHRRNDREYLSVFRTKTGTY